MSRSGSAVIGSSTRGDRAVVVAGDQQVWRGGERMYEIVEFGVPEDVTGQGAELLR